MYTLGVYNLGLQILDLGTHSLGFGAYTPGVYSLGLPIFDLGEHLPVLGEEYEEPLNVNVVLGIKKWAPKKTRAGPRFHRETPTRLKP